MFPIENMFPNKNYRNSDITGPYLTVPHQVVNLNIFWFANKSINNILPIIFVKSFHFFFEFHFYSIRWSKHGCLSIPSSWIMNVSAGLSYFIYLNQNIGIIVRIHFEIFCFIWILINQKRPWLIFFINHS